MVATQGRDAESRFSLGFDQYTIGLVVLDLEGRIAQANAAYCALIGVSEEEVLGQLAEAAVHPDDREVRRRQLAALVASEAESYRAERRFLRPDGSVIWALIDTTAMRDGHGKVSHFFSQLQDITEQKETHFALKWQASHDVLTGLPNRLALQARLDESLERARTTGEKAAVLFIDIDRFKLVNDELGHPIGDELLVTAARILQSQAAPGDLVARFGGDEFVVVHDGVADEADARRQAKRIVAWEDDQVSIGGARLYLSFSCGIALLDGSGRAEEAMRDADAAMYRAKERGPGQIEVFDEGIRRTVTNRFGVEQQLRHALTEGELRVLYQPIMGIADDRMAGAEALVRWQHPQRGLLAPAEFIPAAEEAGIVVGVGEFVLHEALRQVERWRAELPGCRDLWVSVNISSQQLSPGDPVELVAAALADTGAPARALHLEVTETAVMVDVEASIAHLRSLHDLGVSIGVDDFGTGQSSLAYLTTLPVSWLKIDRAFLAGITGGSADLTIVRAILTMASDLGLDVCAEGVETAGQLDVLKRLGCGLGQGYFWSKPLTPAELEGWAVARAN